MDRLDPPKVVEPGRYERLVQLHVSNRPSRRRNLLLSHSTGLFREHVQDYDLQS